MDKLQIIIVDRAKPNSSWNTFRLTLKNGQYLFQDNDPHELKDAVKQNLQIIEESGSIYIKHFAKTAYLFITNKQKRNGKCKLLPDKNYLINVGQKFTLDKNLICFIENIEQHNYEPIDYRTEDELSVLASDIEASSYDSDEWDPKKYKSRSCSKKSASKGKNSLKLNGNSKKKNIPRPKVLPKKRKSSTRDSNTLNTDGRSTNTANSDAESLDRKSKLLKNKQEIEKTKTVENNETNALKVNEKVDQVNIIFQTNLQTMTSAQFKTILLSEVTIQKNERDFFKTIGVLIVEKGEEFDAIIVVYTFFLFLS